MRDPNRLHADLGWRRSLQTNARTDSGAVITAPAPAVARNPAPLFRQQAIDFHRDQRYWGDVALLQPTRTKVSAWAIVVSVLSVLVFLLLAPYARKETVAGYLAPAAGTARIYAPQPGIISAVLVEDGEEVDQGQALLDVATPLVATDGSDVNAAILDALTRQRDLLASQIQAEESRTASEQRRLQSLVEGLQLEVAQIEEQMARQRDRIALAETVLASGARLNPRGLVSDIEYARREEALLEHRQNLALLAQQRAARRNQITEQQSALEQLPLVAGDRIRVLRGELSAAEQRIAEVNARRAYVIRAPIAGRVSALQSTVGQPADPRRLQMSIIPAGGILQAELFVPTRAIGFVRPGQRVRVLYDAFPYQSFGAYGGRVVRVSQAMLTAADSTGPIELREPAYRVTATLDRPDVDAFGRRMPLQPDMLLRADIILDRRPLMAWMLNPLLGAGLRTLDQ